MEGKNTGTHRSLCWALVAAFCTLTLAACGRAVPTASAPIPTQGAQEIPEIQAENPILNLQSEPTSTVPAAPTLGVRVVATHSQAAVTPVRIEPPRPTSTPNPYLDWSTYANVGYGFSFHYPPDWKLEETPAEREANFVKISRGEFVFVVGYKKSGDATIITGGSTTPGNLHHAGEVTFFGQSVAKTTLEHRAKVKSIYYNDVNTEISINNLVFSMRLVPAPGVNYAQIDAPAELQKELDMVIQSFTLGAEPGSSTTPAGPTATPTIHPDGWKSYINTSYGFALDYPPSWTLQEDQHLVKFSQGTLSLMIAFKRASENVNLGPDKIPTGQAELQRGIKFFQQELPKQVIKQDGKVKAVFYTGVAQWRVTPPGAGEALDFVIILFDYNSDYNAVQIPADMVSAADQMLGSFRSSALNGLLPGGLTPTAYPLAQGTPTWKVGFDGSQDWYLLNTANTLFDIENGRMRMKIQKPNQTDEWAVSNAAMIENFYLQATFLSGPVCSGYDRYGLLFRAPQPDRGYVLGFACNGAYRVYKWDGSAFTSLQEWKLSDAIKTGPNQINVMGIQTEGQNFNLYANGVLLATLSDATFTRGQFGLFAGSAETQNLEIFVDEIAYWLR